MQAGNKKLCANIVMQRFSARKIIEFINRAGYKGKQISECDSVLRAEFCVCSQTGKPFVNKHIYHEKDARELHICLQLPLTSASCKFLTTDRR